MIAKGLLIVMRIRTQVDKQTNNAIDLAKFICAILIIMLHVAPFGDTDKGTVFSYLNYGIQNYATRIAVPFFFIASGYFLYRKTTLSTFDVSYSKKYVIRILKLYIIWTLIYMPIVIYGFYKSQNSLIHSVASYIRNVIFTGSYTHLWYLNGLIIAVCLTSFMLYKGVKPLRIIAIASCLYFIGLFDHSLYGFIVPIRDNLPAVWKVLKLIGKIIVTTRNGLFFGFLFIAIGMLFAYYDIQISKSKSLVLFIVSMIMMLFEVFLAKKYGFIRERDMFVFLVPAAFFMFNFVKQVKLRDNTKYRVLRVMSSLMFYTHLWVSWIMSKAIKVAGINTHNSCIRFIVVLFATMLLSYIIYILSNRRRFKWLKVIYS